MHARRFLDTRKELFTKGLDGVRRVYAGEARRYDARWRAYLHRTVSRTLSAVPRPTGGPLLDVGCGSGLLLDRLLARDPHLLAVGVDGSPDMLSVARARLDARAGLVLGDAAALPFRTATFAVVTSSSSMHHWRDPARGLSEIVRVLRPGGTVVLTDWRADHVPTRVMDLVLRVKDESHQRASTTREAEALLEAAGLRVREVERYTAGWTWGLMTITATAPGA